MYYNFIFIFVVSFFKSEEFHPKVTFIVGENESTIYEIKDKIEVVKYEETENYQIMKSFINNKNMMLGILIDDVN